MKPESEYAQRFDEGAEVECGRNKQSGGSRGGQQRPTHWPKLTPSEAKEQLDDLRGWVAELFARFPHITKLPDCWPQHSDLVEILGSLRDAERTCFGDGAPGTAAVEWQRMLREMELRYAAWVKRLPCGINAPGHVD